MKLLQWLDKKSKAKENWQVEVVRKSELFDERWYVGQYQDVFKKLKDPARHYCFKGWRENRNPSEMFETAAYLKKYPECGICPIVFERNRNAKVDLVVCAIVKDEAPYIKEWIDFHLLVGVKRFYIYDNESTDNLKQLLLPYIRQGLVVYKYYPGKAKQMVSYNEFIKNYGDKTEWVAFIDIDEFVIPMQSATIPEFLKDYKEYPGVCINWVSYDSNGYKKQPKGGVMENYTRVHYDENLVPFHLIKSIVQPSRVSGIINPHFCLFKNNELAVNENKEPVGGELVERAYIAPYSVDKIRINHYYCKSRQEAEAKILRGTPEGRFKNISEAEINYTDYKYDYTAYKYVIQLHPEIEEQEELKIAWMRVKNFFLKVKHSFKKSPLYDYIDENWYFAHYPDAKESGLPAARHYMNIGWRKGYNPSEKFDTNFYLRKYKDVAAKRVNPLLHYVNSGKSEGRFALPRETVMSPSTSIEKSKFKTKGKYKGLWNNKEYFDEDWYVENYVEARNYKGGPKAHYHTLGWKKGYNASPRFNTQEYLKKHLECKICPIDFEWNRKKAIVTDNKLIVSLKSIKNKILKLFSDVLLAKNPIYNFFKEKIDYRKQEKKKEEKYTDYRMINQTVYFDKKYYKKQVGDHYKGDLVDHYLHKGYKLGYNPSKDFDNDYYLATHHDILKCGINPLFHYVMAGAKENRKIRKVEENTHINYNELLVKLQKAVPSHTRLLLIVLHEFSLTGAPRAALNFAKIIKENGQYFPIILSMKAGPLQKEFDELGIFSFVDEYLLVEIAKKQREMLAFYSIFPTVIFNCIEALRVVDAFAEKTYKICWVHDGRYGFDCIKWTLDPETEFKKMDKIYSVGEYSKSFTDQYADTSKSDIFLYGIPQQQKLPDIKSGDKFTYGIFGMVCERKAQEVFVEAIRQMPEDMRNKCEFLVVGKLIDNDKYAEKIKYMSKNIPEIKLVGECNHDDTLKYMQTCDIVVCPSLDDPMPIVCTEAMQLKKYIIVSDSTGTAAFVKKHNLGEVCEGGNVEDLAQKMKNMYEKYAHKKDKAICKEGVNVYKNYFSEDVFKQNVNKLLKDIPLPRNIQVVTSEDFEKAIIKPKKVAKVLINNINSLDIGYKDYYNIDNFHRVGDNTGNILINNYGTKQFDYDLDFSPDFYDCPEAEHYIMMCANNLRPNYYVNYEQWFRFLKHLKKPLSILGLGAHTSLGKMNVEDYVQTLPKDMVKLMHMLADRTNVIGCRGEFTYDIIRKLGIKNVEPVGCPTWYVNGYKQPIVKKKEWNNDFKTAFYITGDTRNFGKTKDVLEWYLRWHHKFLSETTYLKDSAFILQSEYDFMPCVIGQYDKEYCNTEEYKVAFERLKAYFGVTDNPAEINQLRTLCKAFYDVDKWAEFIKTRDFCFGFRIHGSIICLKNGIPSFVMAQDSRIKEMSELFKIPHKTNLEMHESEDFNLRKIYEEADYSAMNKEYPKLLENYIAFLDKNGIEHRYGETK